MGAFSSTEKLDAGKKEANSRVANRNSEAKTLSTEIRDAEERKTKLFPLTLQADLISGALHTLESNVRKLEGELGALLTVLKLRRKLTPVVRIIDSFLLPEMEEGQDLYQQVQYLNQAEKSLGYHTWLQLKKSKLDGLESHLDGVATVWSDVILAVKKQRSINGLLLLLNSKNTSSEKYEERLNHTLSVLESATQKAMGAQVSINYLSAAVAYRSRVEVKSKELAENEAALGIARESLNQLTTLDEEQKRQAKLKLALCPKCGKSMEHICGS